MYCIPEMRLVASMWYPDSHPCSVCSRCGSLPPWHPLKTCQSCTAPMDLPQVFPPTDKGLCSKLAEVLKHHQVVSGTSSCMPMWTLLFCTRTALMLPRPCCPPPHANVDAPLLYSYSFDATKTMLSTTTSTTAPTGSVLRKGQLAQELLMQRLVLRTPPDLSTDHMRMVFAEPVSLASGKGMWHVFSAACKFAPLPRGLGHKGPLIHHICADRAQLSAVSRLLQGRTRLYYEKLSSSSSTSALLPELDFFLSCGCALHDVHNSLKWALSPYTQAEALKDSHIVLEALRNSHLPLIPRCAQLPGVFLDHQVGTKLRILIAAVLVATGRGGITFGALCPKGSLVLGGPPLSQWHPR